MGVYVRLGTGGPQVQGSTHGARRAFLVMCPAFSPKQTPAIASPSTRDRLLEYLLSTHNTQKTHLPCDERNMAVDEATQTNGVSNPTEGQLAQADAEKTKWSVESGMS